MDINGGEQAAALVSSPNNPAGLTSSGIQSMEVDMTIEGHPDRSTVVVTEERFFAGEHVCCARCVCL
jgi:hypothetical protein